MSVWYLRTPVKQRKDRRMVNWVVKINSWLKVLRFAFIFSVVFDLIQDRRINYFDLGMIRCFVASVLVFREFLEKRG